jgi:hypothetical protein
MICFGPLDTTVFACVTSAKEVTLHWLYEVECHLRVLRRDDFGRESARSRRRRALCREMMVFPDERPFRARLSFVGGVTLLWDRVSHL